MASYFADRALAERFFLAAISLTPDAVHALSALRGLAFIHLHSGQPGKAYAMIAHVSAMDPDDAVGGSVVAALLEETRFAI